MPGCDCHPRHNHGRLGRDCFLLADGFELCFSLPASLLIISFCFFPVTDESTRARKTRGTNSARLVLLSLWWLTPPYSRFTPEGPNWNCILVSCTRSGKAPWHSLWITAKLFCSLTAAELALLLLLVFLQVPKAQKHQFLEDPGGHFWRATPKLEPPARPILHDASLDRDTGQAGAGGTGPWAALWEPPAVITGLSLWLEPSSSCTAQWKWQQLCSPLTTPVPLPFPVRWQRFF